MQKELVTAYEFKDHFSRRSDCYARYRPSYPDELFAFLAKVVRRHETVWDCATGNGQAAVALARYFDAVTATDASQAQIDAAIQHARVNYSTAPAENSGLDAGSFDLLTVGQAFHWFDEKLFFAEAARVLRPDGILALWSYELCNVNADCDAIVHRLYEDIVAEFWPAERLIVEQGYANADLPGDAVDAPPFNMAVEWGADDMFGFLRTWSACKRYEAANGTDPVSIIEADLRSAWGVNQRAVKWPLNLKLRRLNRPVRMDA